MDWLLQLGDGNVGVAVAVCNCGIALGWLLEPGAYGNVGPVLLLATLEKMDLLGRRFINVIVLPRD